MAAAQAAVQNLHGNFKMEGGTSALTVKFADSEKEKKKRQKLKQMLNQVTMLGQQMQNPQAMNQMMVPGMGMPGMMGMGQMGQMGSMGQMGMGGMPGMGMMGMPGMGMMGMPGMM